MKPTNWRSLAISFGSVFILSFALIAVSLYGLNNTYYRMHHMFDTEIPTQSALSGLLTSLVNEETGVRGMLVSGDPKYLDTYELGRRQAAIDLSQLEAAEAAFAKLRPAAEELQRYFDQEIALVRAGRLSDAQAALNLEKSSFDRFRDLHAQAVHANDRRLQGLWNIMGNNWTIFLAIIAVGMAITLSAGYMFRKLFRSSRETELSLRRKKAQYRSVVEKVKEVIYQIDTDGAWIFLNPAWAELTGFSTEESMGTDALNYIHPDDRGLVLQAVERLRSRKVNGTTTVVRAIRKDGGERWIEMLIATEEEEADEPFIISGTLADITERRKADYELRRSEERYRRVVDFLPEAVVVHIDFKLVFANAATVKLVGEQDLMGVVGHGIEQFVHPGDLQRLKERNRLMIESNMPTELDEARIVKKNGDVVYMEVTSTIIDFEGRQAHLTLLRDITARREAERQVLEQRNLIGRILESHQEGIVLCDQDSTILFANERFSRYYPFDSLEGRTLEECYHSLDTHLMVENAMVERMAAFAEGRMESFAERYRVHLPDRVRHFEATGIPVTNTTLRGNRRETMFVFRDRTDEERINELKNELISTVSHEMRTPLASVLGFVEIMLTRELKPEKQRKYLETVQKEAERLGKLINDFLDIQNMEQRQLEYSFEKLDMLQMAEEVIEQWRGKQPHLLTLMAEAGETAVQADGGRLKQALNNLISNAIKYSPGAERVDIIVHSNESGVEITVRDYGLGIPDLAKVMLFTKFYRVDNSDSRQIGGTGLGLAIVKNIVEAHHGTIVLESEVGKGSAFSIRLPRFGIGGSL